MIREAPVANQALADLHRDCVTNIEKPWSTISGALCWANALLDYGLVRRYRLRVRTGPSQGSDRGSNPRSATISTKPS